MTEVSCYSKYVRVSPKKARFVADMIRGLSLPDALAQLTFLRKEAVRPLMVSLKSAIANAENNLKLKKENLRIKTVEIGAGPALKRFRAVARGTAHPYKKRMSHIKVILEEVSSGSKDKS